MGRYYDKRDTGRDKRRHIKWLPGRDGRPTIAKIFGGECDESLKRRLRIAGAETILVVDTFEVIHTNTL